MVADSDDYLTAAAAAVGRTNQSLVAFFDVATSANRSKCPHADDEANKESMVRFTNHLIVAYSWIMLICGTISNLLSFTVLRSRKLRKSSTFFYLACLSIIDLNVLVLFCVNFILTYSFQINIQKVNIVFCKLFSFLIYFLPQLSGWVCAAVSLDRVVTVVFSSRGRYAAASKKWIRPENSLKVVLVICAFLFAINVHFLFYDNEYERHDRHLQRLVVEDVNQIYCSLEHHDDKFWYSVWIYVDLSLNVLIPFTVMIICSLIIIVGVIKTTGNLKRNSNGNTEKRLNLNEYRNGSNEITTPMIAGSNTTPGTSGLAKKHAGVLRVVSIAEAPCREDNTVKFKQKRSASEAVATKTKVKSKFNMINKSRKASTAITSNTASKARNVSILLATNNFVFIALTLPIVLFLALANFESKIENDEYCAYYLAKLRLVKIICIILMNSNSAINIFIYTLTASDFRRQLFHLIEQAVSYLLCRRDQRGRLASHTSTMRTFDRGYANRKSSSQNPESNNDNRTGPNSNDGSQTRPIVNP